MSNTPEKAVEIALSQVGHGVYKLGTGDCDDHPDDPSDCAGFAINRCYNIRRHRPGFNRGGWATVEDDINCNSAIEDARHKQELFVQLWDPIANDKMQAIRSQGPYVPRPGDLITYPTFRINSKGKVLTFIGHIAIIVKVPAEWEWGLDGWKELTVVQCAGPDGRKPGIFQSSAMHWDAHDKTWPKPEHRTQIIRVKQ